MKGKVSSIDKFVEGEKDFEMGILDGQIAVVSGAGRGIGKAIAMRFATEGSDVFCLSRRAENANHCAQIIRETGRKAWAIAVDVSNSESVKAAVKQILDQTKQIDILVNNAGVTQDGLVMRMIEKDWDCVLDTNLKGAFFLTKALMRPMIQRRSGRIINIASVIGLIGNAGQSNYAASKAGLIGFTKSVARELASRQVTVNVIAPGFIHTDMTAQLSDEHKEAIVKQIPLGKIGEAEDIAEAALFLASPKSNYITGQVLTIDGGMVMNG